MKEENKFPISESEPQNEKKMIMQNINKIVDVESGSDIKFVSCSPSVGFTDD